MARGTTLRNGTRKPPIPMIRVATPTESARRSEGQETMSATTSAIAPSAAAHRWYRLVVLLLGVALAAMTALTVYLAATRTTVTTQSTSPAPVGTSQGEACVRPAIPC